MLLFICFGQGVLLRELIRNIGIEGYHHRSSERPCVDIGDRRALGALREKFTPILTDHHHQIATMSI
jgi:hypothetical protein